MSGYTRSGCGGFGYYDCFCGGDLCVCGYNGEIPCYGCVDCDRDDDYESGEDDQPRGEYGRGELFKDGIRCPRIEEKTTPPPATEGAERREG